MEEEKIQLTLDAEQKPDDALLDSVPTMQSVVKKRGRTYLFCRNF